MNQIRLPSTGASRGRAADVLLGTLALLGTLVIVVGVPVALWLLAGPPWKPEVDDSLVGEASARDVVAVLAIVVWLAWLYFCVCLVVEASAEARGGRLAPRLLGGGAGTQALARRLVAAVVLIGGATTGPVVSAHAISVPADPGPVAELSSAGTGARPTARESGPANEFVPVEQRQTDGIAPYYDVRPPEGRNYETLWDIADRFLGSGTRYKEILDLNRGVVQPDGATLTGTDLIRAGWVLRLPTDAQGAGLRIVDHDLESLEPADAPSESDEADDAGPTAWAPLFGAAGGLLAAGLAAGLRRYRASATIGALVGRRLDPPPNGDAARAPEAALRNEADEPAARMLNRGLRAWTAGATDGVPPIAQCSVSPTGLAVSFHGTPSAAPSYGWKTARDGRVWTIGDAEAERLGEASPAPAPGLVAFGGRDDGSTLLMDLDAFRGIVSVGGESHRARAVAMSFALDTATHAWADRRQVTMVGFADDVTSVADATIRVVDDLAQAIAPLERVAAEQRQACSRVGVRSVHDARFTHDDPLLWQHQLVVCSGVPTTETLGALHELAADLRTSIAVVVVGDVPSAAARLVATDDGRLTCAPIGLDVRAQGIDVAAYRGIVDVYQRTQSDESGSDGPDGPEALAPGVDVTDVDGAQFDPSARQPVEVRLLGPVRVDGVTEISEPRRDLLTEIAAFVALQPGGVHPDTLTAAIWPRGVPDATRDAELERVTTWLGAERFGLVDGLWQLRGPGVRVDWDVFRAYVDHAERMPREAERALGAALDLVRGEAWADLPTGRYGWLAYDSAQVQIPALVIRTARRLSAMLADRGDGEGARDALLRGLDLAPASEQLWCDALRLAERFASPRDIKVVADGMYAAIARHGSPRGARPETDALVDKLLPGYRRSA
ncbi:LysM peptidoglycan-binding domain-containing protein [Solicola gregarius]|uniref:LysM peptidoglycan-binding domain-containing protein n=1 Tax=Solicola gregarius TaxID=2908642 RepID=A0AA46TGV5_9ACTN|nr:LysM peptidoglycan-binding domain-containing protein [Solicola gregarius]UYM04953.1 LysM peptidoglycan-binding domain-containing protein [Solicola gregarius]